VAGLINGPSMENIQVILELLKGFRSMTMPLIPVSR